MAFFVSITELTQFLHKVIARNEATYLNAEVRYGTYSMRHKTGRPFHDADQFCFIREHGAWTSVQSELLWV
jgi:hypothetical protein